MRVSAAPWVQNNPPHSLPPSSLYCSFFLCMGAGKSGSIILSVEGWKAQWHQGEHLQLLSVRAVTVQCSCEHSVVGSLLSSVTVSMPIQMGWGPERGGGGGELQLWKEREAGTSASFVCKSPLHSPVKQVCKSKQLSWGEVLEKQSAFSSIGKMLQRHLHPFTDLFWFVFKGIYIWKPHK